MRRDSVPGPAFTLDARSRHGAMLSANKSELRPSSGCGDVTDPLGALGEHGGMVCVLPAMVAMVEYSGDGQAKWEAMTPSACCFLQ